MRPLQKKPGILSGNVSANAFKAKTLQIKIDNKQESVIFNDATKVKNVPGLKDIKSGMALRVYYKMEGQKRLATSIVVKPKIKVTGKQLMKLGELEKLVAMGPEKGGYTLIDSRPPAGFAKGHIPGAVNIPFPKMNKAGEKILPKDKDKLLVFYCQGFR
jgi:hypothetical protein